MAKKAKNKVSFITIVQTSYITINLFFQNMLPDFSASCTFGFLFSFFPICIMILSLLINVAHTSADIIAGIISNIPSFENIFSIEKLEFAVKSVQKFGIVEIILGIWIVWMARSLFFSLIKGISTIFHTVTKPRPIFNSLLTFLGEILLVILVAAIILINISLRTISKQPLLEKLQIQFPHILSTATQRTFNILPFAILFIILTLVYKLASGTKPSWKMCITSAALCTVIFFVCAVFMNMFLNVRKYNLIYGVLGNLIILLVKAKLFFNLVLFFGQLIFVIQNFDDLLLGELYLLPKYDDKSFWNVFKRTLFIRPDYLTRKEANPDIRDFLEGESIFSLGDKAESIYYVLQGSVQETARNSVSYVDRGSFFGESSCVFNYLRQTEAKASTKCQILVIPKEVFLNLVNINPLISSKTLTNVTSYFSKFHGRNKGFLL